MLSSKASSNLGLRVAGAPHPGGIFGCPRGKSAQVEQPRVGYRSSAPRKLSLDVRPSGIPPIFSGKYTFRSDRRQLQRSG